MAPYKIPLDTIVNFIDEYSAWGLRYLHPNPGSKLKEVFLMKFFRMCILLILIVLAGLSVACSKNKQIYKQADSQLKRGNYHGASIYAAQSLMLKPSYDKAQQALKAAYPKAVQEHLSDIASLMSANNAENWPEILRSYEFLKTLNESVRDLPEIINANTGEQLRFDYRDYSPEIAEAKTQSAQYFYAQGVHYSQLSSSVAVQKQAALFFKKATNYVPGYKDSFIRYLEARQLAMRRIAILPFEDKSGTRNRHGAISDILVDQIIAGILQNRNETEFIELITRDQIDKVIAEQQLSSSGLVDEHSAARIGVLLGAHEILSGRILQIDLNTPRTVSVDLQEKSNITVEHENGEADEELEIECVYRKFTKRSSVQVMASYSVVDVSTGKINIQHSFTAARSATVEWGRFISGDRRALSPDQKDLINKVEPMLPSEKDLINSALSNLSEQFVSHFCRYLE